MGTILGSMFSGILKALSKGYLLLLPDISDVHKMDFTIDKEFIGQFQHDLNNPSEEIVNIRRETLEKARKLFRKNRMK